MRKENKRAKMIKIAAVLIISALAVMSCNKKKWNPVSPEATDTPNIMIPTGTPTVTDTFSATPTVTETFTPTDTHTFTPTFTPTYTITPTYTNTPPHTNTITRTFTQTATRTVTPTSTPTFHWVSDTSSNLYTHCTDCTMSLAMDNSGNAYVAMNSGLGGSVNVYKRTSSGTWSTDGSFSFANFSFKKAGNGSVGPHSASFYNGTVYVGGATGQSVKNKPDCYVCCGGMVVCVDSTTYTIRPALWARGASSWSSVTCGSGDDTSVCPKQSSNDTGNLDFMPSKLFSASDGLYMFYRLTGGNMGISKYTSAFSCFSIGSAGMTLMDSFTMWNGAAYEFMSYSSYPAARIYKATSSGGCGVSVNSIGGGDANSGNKTITNSDIYVAPSGTVIIAYTDASSVYVDYFTGTGSSSDWQQVVQAGGSSSYLGVSADCLYLKGSGNNVYLSFREKTGLQKLFVYKIDASKAQPEMALVADAAQPYVVNNVASSSLDLVNGKPYVAYIEAGSDKAIKLKYAAY